MNTDFTNGIVINKIFNRGVTRNDTRIVITISFGYILKFHFKVFVSAFSVVFVIILNSVFEVKNVIPGLHYGLI